MSNETAAPTVVTHFEGGFPKDATAVLEMYGEQIRSSIQTLNFTAVHELVVAGMILQESRGNPFAIRFEPAFFERYLRGKHFPPPRGVSADTERSGRAWSWGLMQVMGETARNEGFKGSFFAELCVPSAGIYWGLKHLQTKYIRYFDTDGWAGVLAAYNAGSPRYDPDNQLVNDHYVAGIEEKSGVTINRMYTKT